MPRVCFIAPGVAGPVLRGTRRDYLVTLPKTLDTATSKQPLHTHAHCARGQCGCLCEIRDGRLLPEPVPQGVEEVVL